MQISPLHRRHHQHRIPIVRLQGLRRVPEAHLTPDWRLRFPRSAYSGWPRLGQLDHRHSLGLHPRRLLLHHPRPHRTRRPIRQPKRRAGLDTNIRGLGN